jgi:hypothetical protein
MAARPPASHVPEAIGPHWARRLKKQRARVAFLRTVRLLRATDKDRDMLMSGIKDADCTTVNVDREFS